LIEYSNRTKDLIKKALTLLKKMKSEDASYYRAQLTLAYKTYGLTLAELNETDSALKYLQMSHELDQNDAQLAATIGELYESKGQFKEAIGWFHTALKFVFFI
jgi:tetratricopeptide (TPR) repeat protein